MSSVSFTLRMPPELKAAIDAQARLERRSSAFVLQRAAEEYLDRKRAFVDLIAGLEAEADKGAFVSEDAMTRWFDALCSDADIAEPKPDIRLPRRRK
jgi:predicted transcriptional regulator